MAFPSPTAKYLHDPIPITDPTQKHLSVAGKIVLVTGGGTAIGAATVESFAKAQASHIFLTGRRVNLLEDVVNRLSPRYPGTTFHAIKANIFHEDEVSTLFSEINKIGAIDVLVANAGYLPTPGPLSSSETTEWWRGFETNTLGTYLLAKGFLNQQPDPKGTPVFICVNTGVAHIGPLVGPMSAYGASKLAAASVVEFLQAENPKIKTFNVSPGVVKSDMSEKASSLGMVANDSPELAANLAVWLASQESDFLNGRFIWANWDMEQLVKEKEKVIANPSLFKLTLEGWSNSFAVLK